MLIEAYVALAMLAFLAICLLIKWADRAYQEERWTQRWEQRQEQQVADEDAYTDYLDAH